MNQQQIEILESLGLNRLREEYRKGQLDGERLLTHLSNQWEQFNSFREFSIEACTVLDNFIQEVGTCERLRAMSAERKAVR